MKAETDPHGPFGRERTGSNREFLTGLARAFAGAVVFSFSLLMTMEMWALGFVIPPHRLLILVLVSIPLLTGLSYFVGFRDTETLADDLVDAFVAYAVGFISSAVLLFLFGVITPDMSYIEIIGKISLQTVVAAIGAMFAQSELGGRGRDEREEEKREDSGYWGELFIMLIGAVFLAMNVAPTEEIYLIAFQMEHWQLVGLALLSLLMMHGFVYALEFTGQEPDHQRYPAGIVFLRFTVVGYAIALSMSFYLLWTFGSLEGLGLEKMIETTIVLGFPASLGAAASRLLV